jgi:hypothetical protein
MRIREKANQKKMHQLTIENRQLTEPLSQKEELRAKLLEQLKTYQNDKMVLKNLTAKKTQLEEKLKGQIYETFSEMYFITAT